MKAGDWVYLGYVERAHGLRGRIVARLSLAGSAGPLETGTVLRLDDTEHSVTRCSVRDPQRITLQFDDIYTREQADGKRGMSIHIRRSAIDPGTGPVPLHSFVGMELRSDGFSGKVMDVEESHMNPRLLVEGEKGLFPVPVSLVASGRTDWEAGVIHVDLPAGLQDLVE
jgi:ribosomal 30S subunit maturation factor RimM